MNQLLVVSSHACCHCKLKFYASKLYPWSDAPRLKKAYASQFYWNYLHVDQSKCVFAWKKINILKLIIRLSSKSTLEQRIKGACTCISAQSISSYYLQLRSPIRCNMYCFKPKFWLSSHGYLRTTCMHIWNENEFASLMNIVKELTKNFINSEHWAVFSVTWLRQNIGR